ncbi:MAG: tetratricopeptide repeat protein [Treponema sp.]|nr:tetratricopeptide repeat protein [Treponema sp.]
MAAVLEEGIQLYKRKDYTGALSFFMSLSADSGADPIDVSYYLGLCYSKLERYDDALLYLEQVVTTEEKAVSPMAKERVMQCRYVLAVIYSRTARKQLADYELEALLKAGYHTSSVYASFAYLAWENGEDDQCVEYYEKALSIDENNPTALNGLGYVLACEGKDLTRALSLCKKAASLAPNNPACLDSLGWVYYRMGLFSQARKHLEQALKIDGDNEVIKSHLHEAEMVEE